MLVLTWDASTFLYSDICSRYVALSKALDALSPLITSSSSQRSATYS